jgi:hypothetical protein
MKDVYKGKVEKGKWMAIMINVTMMIMIATT